MSQHNDQPLIAIVTLNWNRPDDTLECLASATTQTHPNTFIVVVDNGSSDGSVGRISTAFPDITILQNTRNLGFASGANRGLRHALERGADYVFLVNNDTTFAPDCLTRLLEHTTPDVGALTPAIYYAAQPEYPWSLGGMKHWLTLEKTGDNSKALEQANTNGFLDRDYVVGCGLLLSRVMLAQVGLFDDRFFMYYEDMDLSFRIRQHGFRILLVPTAKMWHKVAMSSGGSDSPDERYWMAHSSVLFFRNYVHGMRWLIVAPFRTGSAIKTMIRLGTHGRFRATRAYLRGLHDGLRTPLCV